MCTNRNVSDIPLNQFDEWQRPTSNNSGEILQRRTNPDTGHDELFTRNTVTEQVVKRGGPGNQPMPQYESGPMGRRGAPIMRERTTHTKVGDAPGSAPAGYRAPEVAKKTSAQQTGGTANKTTARSRRGAAGTILAGSLGGGATILGN